MFTNSRPLQSTGPIYGNANFGMGGLGAESPTGFPNMEQMTLLAQMTNLLASILNLALSEGGVSDSAPQFGAGGAASSSGSPANFLGVPSSGSASPASSGGASGVSDAAPSAPSGDAKDAGGGWTNPVGGDYRISSGFGPRHNPTGSGSSVHEGVDMAAPLNTPILAAKAGKVIVSKDETTGYGKWVEIQHGDGTKSRYAHLNSRGVEVGAQVSAGQPIGKMGSTGNSTGSHLHFEVLNAQGDQIDPTKSMKL